MKNTINTQKPLPISEQREKLLSLNPDLIFGVYKILTRDNSSISLDLIKNTVVCYPNQVINLQIPENCNDINILDILSLRNKEIKFLKGKSKLDPNNTILVSSGVIEYIKGRTGRKHLFTMLRDGGSVDNLKYTISGGRKTSEEPTEEMEKELYEESPFLGKNEKGEYVLAIANGNENGKQYTINSINQFLQKKYNLNFEDEKDINFIRKFERNFPGVSYSDLGTILIDIIENDRFVYYNWKEGEIGELKNDIKNVEVGAYNINAYTFFDKETNTLEFMKIREIASFPKGFHRLGKTQLPCRLYLESGYQVPRIPRIEHAGKNATSIVKKISETIQHIV